MNVKALLVGLAAAAAVAATGAAQAQDKKSLSIATGGTGGVYYPLGGGFGNILGKELGITGTAQVTGGSVANLQLISTGKADLCFSQVDAAWDAVNGLGKFPKKLDIRALVVMYPNHMHAVTVEGTGVNKVEDMKGKRVSTGSPGSATEVYAVRVLEAAGLDHDKDIKKFARLRRRERIVQSGPNAGSTGSWSTSPRATVKERSIAVRSCGKTSAACAITPRPHRAVSLLFDALAMARRFAFEDAEPCGERGQARSRSAPAWRRWCGSRTPPPRRLVPSIGRLPGLIGLSRGDGSDGSHDEHRAQPLPARGPHPDGPASARLRAAGPAIPELRALAESEGGPGGQGAGSGPSTLEAGAPTTTAGHETRDAEPLEALPADAPAADAPAAVGQGLGHALHDEPRASGAPHETPGDRADRDRSLPRRVSSATRRQGGPCWHAPVRVPSAARTV